MAGEDAEQYLADMQSLASTALTPLPEPLPDGFLQRLQSLINRAPRQTLPASSATLGEARIDGFRLEEEVGHGGMGTVYRAWDESLSRTVAVKILSVIPDHRQRDRFQKEAHAAATIRCDHVVPVYSTGRTSDGRPYLVMPLIAGQTLRDRLKSGPLPVGEAAAIVRGVAAGATALHAIGLLHRDIKPANILLDSQDGRAKLTDFGLARSVDVGATLEGSVAGTPEYMSPEQATSPDTVDVRSDVYSLGVTLYECLSGTIPFRGAALEILRQRNAEDPESPRRFNRSIPKDLETICSKAIARDPARRYSTASALADDLECWSQGKSISARPAGRIERTSRWAKRNPLPVAILAVTICGVVASALGWSRSAANARLAEERSEAAERSAIAETEQRQRAEQHLSTARAAVDRFYLRVMDDGLLNDPKLQPQRREVLVDAAGFYQQMLLIETADSKLCRKAIETAHRLGLIQRDLGQIDEAEATLRNSIALAREEIARDPKDVSAKVLLAKSLNTLHVVLWTYAKNELASALDEESVSLLEEIISILPNELGFRRDLAALRANRGNAALSRKDKAAARTEWRSALAQFQGLHQLKPEDAVYRADIARIEFNLGFACETEEQTLECWERARLRRRKLAADPGQALARMELVKNCLMIANSRNLRGEWSEALSAANEGVLLAKVILENGEQVPLRIQLTDSLVIAANASKRLSRITEAYGNYRAALVELRRLAVLSPKQFSTSPISFAKDFFDFLKEQNRGAEAEEVRKEALIAIEALTRATTADSSERKLIDELAKVWSKPSGD